MIKVPIFFQLNKLGLVGATKELKKLSNQTKAFGITSKISIGAATVALAAYTKKSIASAMADQKAQATLAQTLKNVGRAYAAVDVTSFIDKLQRATGVSEELLRPAFEKLVRATGDVTQAQKLLNLTLDISASTGKTTEQVSASLSKAFLGQTQALGRLGIGLSKADLKANSFEEITNKLTKLFLGQAQVAANTYAGQFGILQVSAQEASETIGIALINSLSALSGQNGVKDLASQMESLAKSTANVITNLGKVVKFGQDIAPTVLLLGTVALAVASIGTGGAALVVAAGIARVFTAQKFLVALGLIGSIFGLSRNFAAPAETNRQSPRAAEQAQLNADKLLKTKKATVAVNKQITATEKLKAMFDIDSIQIAAALKGKISDLDRASLLAMQALKTVDKNDDITALKNLEQAKISADAADRSRKISALQDTINFNKLALADVESTIAKIAKIPVPIVSYGGSLFAGTSLAPTGTSAVTVAPIMPQMPSTNAGASSAMPTPSDSLPSAYAQSLGITQLTVNVNPSGSGFVGNQDDFLRTVQMALQIGGRNGYSTSGLATG